MIYVSALRHAQLVFTGAFCSISRYAYKSKAPMRFHLKTKEFTSLWLPSQVTQFLTKTARTAVSYLHTFHNDVVSRDFIKKGTHFIVVDSDSAKISLLLCRRALT